MKISRGISVYKEKRPMKQALLTLVTVVLILNTMMIVPAAHADGGAGSTSCNGKMCKPVLAEPAIATYLDGGAGSTSCNGKMCKP